MAAFLLTKESGWITGQVINIVYLSPASVSEGGFFPNGVNGDITTSDDND